MSSDKNSKTSSPRLEGPSAEEFFPSRPTTTNTPSKLSARAPSCSFDERKNAGPLPVCLGDHLVCHVEPRRFSNDSYGLSFIGRVRIPLPDGGIAECQCCLFLSVIGSHDADVDGPSQKKRRG